MEKLDKLFEENDLHPFRNYVKDDSQIITVDDLDKSYNRFYFDLRKNSAFCNIINIDKYEGDVLYYLFLDDEEKIDEIIHLIEDAGLKDELYLQMNYSYDEFAKDKKLKYLKIYDITVKELKGFKEYIKKNNKRLVSFTSDKKANYLLDISDYVGTFYDNLEAKNVDLRFKNFEELFIEIKRMYYSKKYEK